MKNLLFASLLLAAVFTLVANTEAQVIVIANPSVKTNELSKSDLRDIFSGSSSSLKDGSHVIPVLLKEGAAEDEFLSAYVGKSDAAFRASWRSLVFSGQAAMPKSLDSEEAMVEYVAHNVGAIGYIRKEMKHEGIKVLTVK